MVMLALYWIFAMKIQELRFLGGHLQTLFFAASASYVENNKPKYFSHIRTHIYIETLF